MTIPSHYSPHLMAPHTEEVEYLGEEPQLGHFVLRISSYTLLPASLEPERPVPGSGSGT